MTTTSNQVTSTPVPAAERPGRGSPASPEQLVDALHGVFGRAPAARAIHAKGVVLEGAFRPARSAVSLSKAPHLHAEETPVVVRFSNFSGVPTVSDIEPKPGPSGMAVKFRLPDLSATDIVAHSYNGFATRTADELRALFVAIRASTPSATSPSPLEQFFGEHPAARAFMNAPNPLPATYGNLDYYGVNSFLFTNAAGEKRFGRYRIEPADGSRALPLEQKLTAGADYIAAATIARVQSGPILFRLGVQLADAADVIDDPSTPWPDTRQVLHLGIICIARTVDDEAFGRALAFDPALVPPGIEVADPMLRARSAAYKVSHGQRTTACTL